MTATWLFAYVVLPIVVVGIGYVAVRLHEWDSRRNGR